MAHYCTHLCCRWTIQHSILAVIWSRELGQAPILVFLTPRQALSSHPCQVLNRINIDFILISRHSKFFYCFWRRWDWDTSCFRSHMHVSKSWWWKFSQIQCILFDWWKKRLCSWSVWSHSLTITGRDFLIFRKLVLYFEKCNWLFFCLTLNHFMKDFLLMPFYVHVKSPATK